MQFFPIKLENSLLNFEIELRKLPLQDERALSRNSSHPFLSVWQAYKYPVDDMTKYSIYLFITDKVLEKEPRNFELINIIN